MAVTVPEAVHLILDRWAITRPNAADLACEQGGAVERSAYDFMRAAVRARDRAEELGCGPPARHRGHCPVANIGGLSLQPRPVYGPPIQARRRAGLEARQGKIQRPKLLREFSCRPLADSLAWAALPLVAEGQVLGAMGLSFGREGALRPEDRALAVALAQQCAQAFERARLFEAERQARHEAERASRAKSEFLATVSHELRTPLNAIGGYAQLLDMGLHGPVTDAQRADLARIQRSQRHLLGLINEVLNLARLESGTVTYDLRPTLVADAVAAVTPLVEPQRTAKDIALDVRVPEAAGRAPVPVLADPDKLQQVLLNLLSNAIKFTPAGGLVTVELLDVPDAQGRALLRVSDTGIGVPADRLEAIFEPFVQVGRSFKTPAEGTGLGLAISRDLARGMGGDLTAESTLGAGSTFTLALPMA